MPGAVAAQSAAGAGECGLDQVRACMPARLPAWLIHSVDVLDFLL